MFTIQEESTAAWARRHGGGKDRRGLAAVSPQNQDSHQSDKSDESKKSGDATDAYRTLSTGKGKANIRYLYSKLTFARLATRS